GAGLAAGEGYALASGREPWRLGGLVWVTAGPSVPVRCRYRTISRHANAKAAGWGGGAVRGGGWGERG
ncbi:hypothetical protein, partial [Streptomyces sp. SA3_actF]|uniref:hypothetical protein n=1 Tax=Streptomyces sp. SA3_actF TaxID=682181 RepID=UPI001F35268C